MSLSLPLPTGSPGAFSDGQYKIFSYQWQDRCADLLSGQPNANVVSVPCVPSEDAMVWNLTFVGNRATWQFTLINADPNATGAAYASVDDNAKAGSGVLGSTDATVWILRAGPGASLTRGQAYQIEAKTSTSGKDILPNLVWSLDNDEPNAPIKLATFNGVGNSSHAWIFEKQTFLGTVGNAARHLDDLD